MNRIKLFTLVITCLFCVCASYADQNVYSAIGTNKLDVSTRVRVGDIWGDNWNRNYRIATRISDNTFVVTLFPKKDEAWNYYCKITVKDFVIPNKKAIREKQKKEELWYYSCEIEFYYNVEYPSLEECFANYGGFVVNSKDSSAKKRTVEGIFALNPYFFSVGKNFGEGTTKNMHMWIDFDGVAMHIYLKDHLVF